MEKKELNVPIDLLNQILMYLQERPYKEVAKLINDLAALDKKENK